MIKRLPVALLVLATACNSHKPQPLPVVVSPRFYPANNPPEVPLPNDLAPTDPKTGLLSIVPDPSASEADRVLISYLNTLNGFPPSTAATVTFTGALDTNSISASSVRVLDVTPGAPSGSAATPVEGVDRVYTAQSDPDRPGLLTLEPPLGGWLAGHTYAVALVGGSGGLQGAKGEPVVGTPTWALIRNEGSLVTCTDLTLPDGSTNPDCQSATDVLPAMLPDGGVLPPSAPTAEILRAQANTAVLLEGLRRKYKPVIDVLVQHDGLQRKDVALLWTFKIHDLPTVVFNPNVTPPKVPTPTDLAIDPVTGLVNAPIDPSASPAEQEFYRDYLNTLTAFPAASTATAQIVNGDFDLSSVTPDTVRVFELPPRFDAGVAGELVRPTITYVPSTRTLVLTPAGGLWPKGRTFAVALLSTVQTADGGVQGLRTTDGGTPVGSEVWALLRSDATLATCDDAGTCRSNVTVAPVSPAQALQAETARQQLKPMMDLLADAGIRRSDVAVAWSFSIVPNAEALFDPTSQLVPFPNDLIRTPADGGQPAHVNVPVPDGGTPAAIALVNQLNTLDGFSTTGTSISETSDARGALDIGVIDRATLDAGVGYFRLSPGAAPQVSICLDCDSTRQVDGGAPNSPEQLQVVPIVPLEDQATYAGYVTTDLADTRGYPVISSPGFALLRSENPLVDATGKSLVSLLSDDLARQAEPARLTLKPVIDALVQRGIPRSKISLAWGSTTLTLRPTVQQLYNLPSQLGAALPTTLAYLKDESIINTGVLGLNANPYPHNNVSKIFMGKMSIADVLTGPNGTLNIAQPVIKQIRFFVTIPTSAAPASGYPVAIWGHPITASNLSLLGIANALAGIGIATISIDLPWHGQRSTCIGSKDSLALSAQGATSDNAACNNTTCNETTGQCAPATSCNPLLGDADCLQINEGVCTPTGVGTTGICEGPSFKQDATTHAPVISGWNFISSDLFATRDALRQHVVDIAQLERVIRATGPNTLNALLASASVSPLDGNKIHFVGMSLGGMVGAISASVSPNIHRVALNAVGADIPTLLLNGLTPEARAAFLQQAAANGLTPGTPAFDQFLNAMRWALDPGDPANHVAWILRNSGTPADRRVLVQYIQGDPVVPNPNTQRIISSLGRLPGPQCVLNTNGGPCTVIQDTAAATISGTDRHIYLINLNNPTLMNQAQSELINFMSAP